MSPVGAHRCKAGKICDNGVERSLKGKTENCDYSCGGGCIAVIIILFVILPLCCIGCSVAACCIAVQQNNRQPQARIQQQPVAYAQSRPAGGAYAPGQPVYGGAVQMQQYGKQPYQAWPVVVQPTVVQPTVVQPCVDIKFYSTFVLILRVNLHAIDAPLRWRGDAGSSSLDGASTAAPSPRMDLVKYYRLHPTHWLISTQVQPTVVQPTVVQPTVVQGTVVGGQPTFSGELQREY